MRPTLILRAAIFAGAGLLWPLDVSAQEAGFATYDGYLDTAPGEVCPPLLAPSPFVAPPVPYGAPRNEEDAPPPPAAADAETTPAPTVDDFAQNQALPQDFMSQPIQQSFAPPATTGNLMAAATGPQSIAPNMIGDFFGTSGGSMLTISPRVLRFADSFRNPNGSLVFFDASLNAMNFGELRIPSNLQSVQIVGQQTVSIPQGTTVWTSQNPFTGGPQPAVVALQENPDETSATTAAFPSATAVHFVEGVATQSPHNSLQYSIFTDYVIDFANGGGPEVSVLIPDPGAAPGAVVGRQKIADNSSPLPRTRVFLNYSYFEDTPLTTRGANVSRVTPGFEYAFLGNNASIEVRAPFASTLSSDVNIAGSTSTSEIEFGNLTMYLKGLMWESDTFSWSAGLGMTLPTADDVEFGFNNINIFRIENESIHLLPFLGFLWTPRERCFVQGFLQFDVDTNGNPVEVSDFNRVDANGIPTGLPSGNLRRIGRADDSTYTFIDLGIGYWIYRNRCGDRFINGLAPTFELHYNAATEGTDTISSSGQGLGVNVQVGRPGDVEVTNAVFGLNAVIGDSGTLTLGYATPVSGDDQFDGEIRVFFNWFFGPQTPGRASLINF